MEERMLCQVGGAQEGGDQASTTNYWSTLIYIGQCREILMLFASRPLWSVRPKRMRHQFYRRSVGWQIGRLDSWTLLQGIVSRPRMNNSVIGRPLYEDNPLSLIRAVNGPGFQRVEPNIKTGRAGLENSGPLQVFILNIILISITVFITIMF